MPHPLLSVSQLDALIKIADKFVNWMANSTDSEQLASSETDWSGSIPFAKAEYIWDQQDKG